MRKNWLFVFPLFLIALCFCGCGNLDKNELDNFIVEFSCPELITMKLVTADINNEFALAPLVSNVALDNCTVVYDEDIIKYDASTGLITALKAGKTILKATAGDISDYVEIVVDEAVYCTSLSVTSKGAVFMNCTTAKIEPIVNKNYNMGFDFLSYNEDILKIDAEGNLTPIKTGKAKIKVTAKTAGIANSDNEYETTFVTKIIEVLEERNSLNIEILNSDLTKVDAFSDEAGITNYDLFWDNAKPITYLLKIDSNCDYDYCYFKEDVSVINSGILWEWDSNFYVDCVDEQGVLYRPFYLTSNGSAYVQQQLIDYGINYSKLNLSNMLKINSYRATQNEDLSYKLYNDNTKSEAYNTTIDGRYKLTFEEEPKFVSISLSAECYPKLNLTFENLVCSQVEGGYLVEATDNAGNASLTISSMDNQGASVTINFFNIVKAETILIEDYETEIYLDGQGVGAFEAYYTVKDKQSNITEDQNCYIVFYDEKDNEISLDFETLGTKDVTFKSVYIEFLKAGEYRFQLVSVLGYTTNLITISVLP